MREESIKWLVLAPVSNHFNENCCTKVTRTLSLLLHFWHFVKYNYLNKRTILLKTQFLVLVFEDLGTLLEIILNKLILIEKVGKLICL